MKKHKVIAIVAVLLFMSILLVVGLLLNRLNTTKIEEHSFYQYFIGRKFEYQGGLKLTRKNDITELTFQDTQVQLDSTPVYYADIENKVLFPEDMALVFPSQNGLMYKIDHFSNLFFETETTYLEKEGRTALKNAFLFDGQDLYFFLEKTTLKVGEEQYELSPLSYVICSYQDTIEIYQKEQDKYTILENKSKEVLASTSEYTINLNTDSIQMGEQQQLLIKNKDKLQNF